MTRRITLLFTLLLLCAGSAWPKFNDEDKKYLDDQFRSIQDQVQAMQNQIQILNTQLQQLKDNQTQLQAFLVKQQRAINDINQLVSSISLGDEDHYSTLKKAIEKMSSETQTSFNKISPGAGGGTTTPAAVTNPQPLTSPTKPTVHYVMVVKGDDVLVDLTSLDGIRQGTKLALYKASDPNTHVGELEVTEVTDSASHAKIIAINKGVTPEFSDIVRVEQ